ncbi:DUF2235 domain-containing protein [Moraxella lincolnii]|uniref:phospholipase effector Tle1 domain-containing protein n=2 Tax=Moraxellaceae TaxID=468 RepID=UPI0030CE02C6
MGLYDTVPAFGSNQDNDMQNIRAFGMNLDVSNSDFQTIVHAVATNENRAEFARRSIYISQTEANSKNDKTINDKYRLEKGFLGAHSDIGGGYESGDLSNVALMWMIKQAQEKGNIKFKDYSQYKQINNPIVHDSSFTLPFSLGGEFRWATDSSKDYDKTKIFNNFKHLELNWNDTKAFENPNNKKLDKLQNATEIIAKNKQKGFFKKERVPYVGNLVKDAVLMANGKGEIIALHDYITWVNCNYGLALKTERNKDFIPSNLSEEKLCSGTPLQNYVEGDK